MLGSRIGVFGDRRSVVLQVQDQVLRVATGRPGGDSRELQQHRAGVTPCSAESRLPQQETTASASPFLGVEEGEPAAQRASNDTDSLRPFFPCGLDCVSHDGKDEAVAELAGGRGASGGNTVVEI